MKFFKQLDPNTRAFLQGILVAPLVWAFLVVFLILGDLFT